MKLSPPSAGGVASPAPRESPLWAWLIEALIRILPIEVNAWDRFSIRQRHFIHEPVSQPNASGASVTPPP